MPFVEDGEESQRRNVFIREKARIVGMARPRGYLEELLDEVAVIGVRPVRGCGIEAATVLLEACADEAQQLRHLSIAADDRSRVRHGRTEATVCVAPGAASIPSMFPGGRRANVVRGR